MGNPVVHFEIVNKEGDKLRRFYSEAFGWKIDAADNPMGYGMVDAETEGIGGGIANALGDYPGHLTFYIQTDDLEGTLARIEELGGETVMPPDSVGDGTTIAQFKDPGGNMVGLVKGM
jgi:predicted enzyme related to lactoylglutathione lyase